MEAKNLTTGPCRTRNNGAATEQQGSPALPAAAGGMRRMAFDGLNVFTIAMITVLVAAQLGLIWWAW